MSFCRIFNNCEKDNDNQIDMFNNQIPSDDNVNQSYVNNISHMPISFSKNIIIQDIERFISGNDGMIITNYIPEIWKLMKHKRFHDKKIIGYGCPIVVRYNTQTTPIDMNYKFNISNMFWTAETHITLRRFNYRKEFDINIRAFTTTNMLRHAIKEYNHIIFKITKNHIINTPQINIKKLWKDAFTHNGSIAIMGFDNNEYMSIMIEPKLKLTAIYKLSQDI